MYLYQKQEKWKQRLQQNQNLIMFEIEIQTKLLFILCKNPTIKYQLFIIIQQGVLNLNDFTKR
jgi:hypothetical protein